MIHGAVSELTPVPGEPTVTMPAGGGGGQAERVCLFLLADQPFAVPVSAARQVVNFDDYTIVPSAPASVIGVASLRGTIVPVLDIQPLLGLDPRTPSRPITTLVVADGAAQVGLAIDQALGLEAGLELVPFAEATRRQYGAVGWGLLRWRGRFVPLLDVRALIETLRRRMAGRSVPGGGTAGDGRVPPPASRP